MLSGCKKEVKKPVRQPSRARGEKPVPRIQGALAEDTAYANGKVQAAVMEIQTRVALPDLGPQGEVSEEVKRAQERSVLTQTLTVTEDRGKMVFETPDFYIPKGTELRYNPAHKRYVLAAMDKRIYWAMSGAELGNLLEGGPVMRRTSYTVELTDTTQKEVVAGVEAVRTDAELGFDWSIRAKTGERKGKIRVKLAIWHSADPKLKESWGRMMVDFLTVPFQDESGKDAVEKLKSRVKFPVKWVMEVHREGQARDQADLPARLLTTARRLDIVEVDRRSLASPPAGLTPATSPYSFGEGGQTASEELLSKLPAQPRAR
jgi:hypothetical protein